MPEKNKFFKISRSIRDITPVARGQVLMGWGDADHRALEVREKINVRLVWCQDEKKESLLFFQFDICMMSAYLRERLLESLLSCESLQSFYLKRESFVFSATHTHAAPGGYCKEALYQLGSLGIDEDFILLLIQKTKECVVEASKKFIHGKIIYGDGIIPDSLSIFHNRSLDAFLENKEVKEGKLNASDSIPRNFPVLRCEDESGNPLAMLSFIGLHGTCIHQDTKCIHPDHKGLASRFSEEKYGSQSPGFIALYLQGAAGDLTPNFKRHSKKDMKRGVSVNDFESVEFVAKTQCKIVEEVFESLKGKNSEDPQIFTRKEEDVHFFNSSLEGPAMGVTFFKSTLEGRVPLKAAAFLATVICRMFKVNEEQRRAHAPKKLAIDASCRRLFFFRMKEQSFIGHAFFLPFYFLFKKWKKSGEMESLSLLPEKQTLSLQKCGEIFIITCPGEFTLQSGRRMENIVRETFKSGPLKNNKILLIGYTNGHGSYVTTEEEYLLQRYEGASTLYGRKTLQHYEEALYRLATYYLSESEANERKGAM